MDAHDGCGKHGSETVQGYGRMCHMCIPIPITVIARMEEELNKIWPEKGFTERLRNLKSRDQIK